MLHISFIALVTLCYSYLYVDLSLPPECELLKGKDFISLTFSNAQASGDCVRRYILNPDRSQNVHRSRVYR